MGISVTYRGSRGLAGLVAGLWALAGIPAGAAAAGSPDAVFDNPRDGSTACMMLESYSARPTSGGSRVSASIRNLCGRSLDVEFCFLYADEVDGADRRCFSGAVRPGGRTRIPGFDAPATVAGPAYRWRYLPE